LACVPTNLPPTAESPSPSILESPGTAIRAFGKGFGTDLSDTDKRALIQYLQDEIDPMFVGHYGVSFLARSKVRSTAWVFFLATQFLDLLWVVLVLTGLEGLQITPE